MDIGADNLPPFAERAVDDRIFWPVKPDHRYPRCGSQMQRSRIASNKYVRAADKVDQLLQVPGLGRKNGMASADHFFNLLGGFALARPP